MVAGRMRLARDGQQHHALTQVDGRATAQADRPFAALGKGLRQGIERGPLDRVAGCCVKHRQAGGVGQRRQHLVQRARAAHAEMDDHQRTLVSLTLSLGSWPLVFNPLTAPRLNP